MNNDEFKQMMEFLGRMMGSQTTNEDCGEMPKLIEMLKEANIPFESFSSPFSGKQVCYYGKGGRPEPEEGVFHGPGVGAVCSVIYGYGRDEGLLEISGLMTDEEYEKENDSVLGYLTAENVFARIKKHWESEQ